MIRKFPTYDIARHAVIYTHIHNGFVVRSRIRPAENLGVSIVAMGEGWHNYHHVFPWDYKAAELGNYYNVTTFWIEQFAKIGWAYDLKQPSDELIRKTAEKHGTYIRVVRDA